MNNRVYDLDVFQDEINRYMSISLYCSSCFEKLSFPLDVSCKFCDSSSFVNKKGLRNIKIDRLLDK